MELIRGHMNEERGCTASDGRKELRKKKYMSTVMTSPILLFHLVRSYLWWKPERLRMKSVTTHHTAQVGHKRVNPFTLTAFNFTVSRDL